MAVDSAFVKNELLRNVLNGSSSLASKNNTAYGLNADLMSEFVKRGGDINDLSKKFDTSTSAGKASVAAFQNIANNAASISPTISTPYQNVSGIVIPGVTRHASALQTALNLVAAGMQGYNTSKQQQQDSINKAKTFVALQQENLRKEALQSDEKQKDRDSRERQSIYIADNRSKVAQQKLDALDAKEEKKDEVKEQDAVSALQGIADTLPILNKNFITANKYGYVGPQHLTKMKILDNEADGKFLTGAAPAFLSGVLGSVSSYGITSDDRKGYNASRTIENLKKGEVARSAKKLFVRPTNFEVETLIKSMYDRALSFDENRKNLQLHYKDLMNKVPESVRKKYPDLYKKVMDLIDSIGSDTESNANNPVDSQNAKLVLMQKMKDEVLNKGNK